MGNFIELSNNELLDIDGGGVWGKIGCTLMTVGGVMITGVNPVSASLGVVAIYTIWA